MIGYMIEQELGNLLPEEVSLATILTMIEVDPSDSAFADPTKFVGPVYDKQQAGASPPRRAGSSSRTASTGVGWCRRLSHGVSSRSGPLRGLLEHGTVVICAGGVACPPCSIPRAPSAPW